MKLFRLAVTAGLNTFSGLINICRAALNSNILKNFKSAECLVCMTFMYIPLVLLRLEYIYILAFIFDKTNGLSYNIYNISKIIL